MVEYLPSKQVVAGSSPVFRSIKRITPLGVFILLEIIIASKEYQ